MPDQEPRRSSGLWRHRDFLLLWGGQSVSELGSAGVDFAMDKVSVAYGDVVVCASGVAAAHDASALAAHLAGRHIEIVCDLGLGTGTAAVLGTDLGYGYIDENRTTS